MYACVFVCADNTLSLLPTQTGYDFFLMPSKKKGEIFPQGYGVRLTGGGNFLYEAERH